MICSSWDRLSARFLASALGGPFYGFSPIIVTLDRSKSAAAVGRAHVVYGLGATATTPAGIP
jgi:hypothetical protein